MLINLLQIIPGSARQVPTNWPLCFQLFDSPKYNGNGPNTIPQSHEQDLDGSSGNYQVAG